VLAALRVAGAACCVAGGFLVFGRSGAEQYVSQPAQVHESVQSHGRRVAAGAERTRQYCGAVPRCPDLDTLPEATAILRQRMQQFAETSIPNRESVFTAAEVTMDGLNLLSRQVLDLSSIAGREICAAGSQAMQRAEETNDSFGDAVFSGLSQSIDATIACGTQVLGMASTLMFNQMYGPSSSIDPSKYNHVFPLGPDSAEAQELIPSLLLQSGADEEDLSLLQPYKKNDADVRK